MTEPQYTLEDLQTADKNWRIAKGTLEAQLRAELERRILELRAERDKVAYRLARQGIPKTRIAKEGLGTSATITAYEAIKHGAEVLGVDLDANPIVGGKGGKVEHTIIKWSDSGPGEVIEVTLGKRDYERALALDGDMEQMKGGLFLNEEGRVEPHTPDMSIPAVALFFRDDDFAKQLEDFAASA
ncbi:MAG: hypothetical protein ACTH4Y_11530 [Microbacterium gubbeenense]|uniref:hypothetical protein n=1 Tax=Microbacterium gubbeenense TaxID=159896 RepID=UPI003F994513